MRTRKTIRLAARRRLPRAALVAALALPALLFLGAGRGYEPPLLKVRIGVLGQKTSIAGKKLGWKGAPRGGTDATLELTWDGRSMRLNGKKASLPLTFSADGPVQVAGLGYRGKILILPGSPPSIINLVDAESYVAGVINQEIDARWPDAAVDAQAVLARTYALKKLDERADQPYHLDRTVNDQVYGGMAAEDDAAWASVKRTRGLVMTYKGQPATGLYHSCCGGRTELPSEVWGGHNLPYQQSVVCPYCQDAPRYFWRYPENGALSPSGLAQSVGLRGQVVRAEVEGRDMSGRATRVVFATDRDTLELSGQQLRKRVGYSRLFSTALQIEKTEEGFVFRGSGSGHGVGLCQWGAKGMAERGFSFEAILGYYFPGTGVQLYTSR